MSSKMKSNRGQISIKAISSKQSGSLMAQLAEQSKHQGGLTFRATYGKYPGKVHTYERNVPRTRQTLLEIILIVY